METATNLDKKLFKNYTAMTRPVLKPDTKINVSIALHVQHLEVDQNAQTMTVHGYLSMKWMDEYLKWDKAQYAGQEKIHVPLYTIWRPDINTYNSASGKDDWHISYQYPAWIKSTGEVTVFPPSTFRVTCSFDYTKYPYDTQKCPVIIGSFKYMYEEVDFTHWTTNINFFMQWETDKDSPTSRYHVAGWRITNSSTEKKYYGGAEGSKDKPNESGRNWLEMYFWLHIERHEPYYQTVFLLPAVVTSVFTVFAFLLESPRLQMMVLVLCLMTQGILLRTLVEKMPPVSGALPKIAKFYAFNLSMTFIGIIVVLSFAGLLGRSDKVPAWFARLQSALAWSDPATWVSRTGIGAGSKGLASGHQKFENEPEDNGDEDEDEPNKEQVEDLDAITKVGSGPKSESGALNPWFHVFETLSRAVFLAYSATYFLAMMALLT